MWTDVGLATQRARPRELHGLLGWVADVVDAMGAVGVGLLVALENLFPPIPSEVVLPFAGFIAGQGRSSITAMILAATVGSVGGAVVLYEIGGRIGLDRTRRALVSLPLVEAEEVDRAIGWFRGHGDLAVFTGRFVPVIRSLVSLPAGSSRLPRWRFLLLTALGSAIWNSVWVVAGFQLGRRWDTVGRYADWLNYALWGTVAILIARFVWSRRDRIPRRGS